MSQPRNTHGFTCRTASPATRLYLRQVVAAKEQIAEENRLNMAELPDDVTLLNPPKIAES